MSNNQKKWEFTEKAQKMGMGSDIFEKALSHEFPPEAILIREALQNCKDARPEGSELSAQVTIRNKKLDGPAVKRLADVLKLKNTKDRSDHIKDPERRKQFTQLINGDIPLNVLEIADENTIGLGGEFDGDKEHDHFSRLVINLADGQKSKGGGSFGFGKTVFASQSRLHLVVYYSVFEPNADSDNAHARLMAVWLMEQHRYGHEEKKQSGFAFFGQPDPSKPETVQPFVDDAAHAMAEALGITKRSREQKGTTVMVIDCDDLSMRKIAESAELYWWPSIQNGELSIRVYDGDEQIPIKIKKNPRVKPFLTAYQDLQTDPPRGRTQKKYSSQTEAKEFDKAEGKKLGYLATRQLSPFEIEAWEKHVSGEKDPQIGGIARIRPGAGMVVSYETDNISQSKPCIALYQADNEIEQFLRMSEPPTHDRWNSGDDRLNIAKHFSEDEWAKDRGKKIVSTVNNRIRNSVRDFLKDTPDLPPPAEYKLNDLENLLAKLMNAGNQAKGIPPGDPRPSSLSVKTKRKLKDGKFYDNAEILMKLNADYPNDELDIEVIVTRFLIGVRTTECVVEKLNCIVEDIDSGYKNEGESVIMPVTLKKGKIKKLNATGGAWNKFKTKFNAEVRRPS